MNSLTLSIRSQRTQLTRKLAAVAVVGVFTAFAPLHAAAQVAANHAAIWTGGDTIYVDLAAGVDQTRAVVSSWGGSSTPYQNLQFALQDVLQNAPKFPVVFNVIGSGVVHQVSDLRLPAYGVKLQPYVGSSVTLDGGGGPLSGIQTPPVLRVDTEGPRALPGGGVTPASIIQGFTITGGGIGVELNVQGSMATDPPQPLRTEVRDCIITENKYRTALTMGGTTYRGGTGIRIVSWADAPTQYVIENNQIFDHADFFPGWASSGGPSSWGIYIEGRQGSRESTLIRGNQIAQQETGIGITGPGQDSAWVRPRILSNFLAEHEQHVFSIGNCGPAFINNTVFRVRDYCEGPDRHIVHHSATPTPLGSDPYNERTAMVVRNCIFDYFTPTPGNPNLALANDPIAPLPLGAVRPYDPIVGIPGNVPWPIATFGGGGAVDVAFTDLDLPFGPLTAPRNTPADLRALGVAWTPLFAPAAGNFQNRPVPFVNPAGQPQLPAPRPDLHLLAVAGVPTAPMIEGGDLASTLPGVMINLDGQLLPCDVRIDVDGDARACDFDTNGSLLPDRGADEVLDVQVGAVLALNSGLRLTTNADANGNVLNGATVAFTVQGRPNEAVILLGWLDCPTDLNDDVVSNHVFLPPVGNVLLPLCGLVNSPVLVLNAQGFATFSLPLAATPEFQAYFQAVGLSAPGVPATGHASNRVRIELN